MALIFWPIRPVCVCVYYLPQVDLSCQRLSAFQLPSLRFLVMSYINTKCCHPESEIKKIFFNQLLRKERREVNKPKKYLLYNKCFRINTDKKTEWNYPHFCKWLYKPTKKLLAKWHLLPKVFHLIIFSISFQSLGSCFEDHICRVYCLCSHKTSPDKII